MLKAAETLEAWDEGNQLAIPILCSMTYLTLRATADIPLTGHEDNVPPDNTGVKTSVDGDDAEKLIEIAFPRKTFITVDKNSNDIDVAKMYNVLVLMTDSMLMMMTDSMLMMMTDVRQ